jgi:quinol monooxygenase YgiN/quercetin dioxygenase-like cupin family protein
MKRHKFSLMAALGFSLLATVAAAQDPVPLYPDNYKVLLENDKVRVLHFILRKGDTEQLHHHPPAVTYVLTPFKIRFTLGDGRVIVREAKAGDVFYGDDILHSPLNIGDTDASGILVEMKKPLHAAAGPAGHDPEWLTAITFVKGIVGKEDELKQELLALAAPTRAEPDCITYDLYQSEANPNEFVRFEVWRNPQALENHKQTPHIRGSFAKRQLQGWSTNITLYRRVPEK